MRGDEKLAERERRVISLVGGGGKTTTMYAPVSYTHLTLPTILRV